MILIKLEPDERKELKKRVEYLQRHGDDHSRTLSKAMIARKIHISEPTLSKALNTNKGLSIDIHDKIVEWLEKGK
ncbi:hypothetical protein [Weissella viridescens]|uniref:hypothetical protein n=1 Tax=Weissella viridescens TaxID=1629 RepID=UPI003AF2CCAF